MLPIKLQEQQDKVERAASLVDHDDLIYMSSSIAHLAFVALPFTFFGSP